MLNAPIAATHSLLPIFRTLVAFVLLAFATSVCIAPSVAHANEKYAGIVIDQRTGKTLYSYKADQKRYPASLTKMMTLYMLFDAMKSGHVKKSTPIRISSYAASMVPSKLGIRAGGSITAEAAILALVTKSANDVAAAVAEHLGGTESQFGVMMTRKARALGMKSTTFKNASGLTASGQITTARDMARLGIALQQHFPSEYKYFSTRSFRYGKANYSNHNRLLGKVRGVDGIKTGYTRASGYNLVSSVNTGGRSIVAVVLGGRTGASRNAQMEKLIATYLPKASTRGKAPLIAKAPSSSPVAAQVADIGSIPLSRLPVPAISSTRGPEPAQAVAAYAPTPRPQEPLDTISTASTAPREGWVIQIASLETQQQALDYLRTAQSRAAKVLGGRDPFVQEFQKGGTIYHRARFAGFASKSAAWNACSSLKAYKYSCLAYQN